MIFSSNDLPRTFGEEYDSHYVFSTIKIIMEFYDALSVCTISNFENGAIFSDSKVFSTSTYIYGSLEGTMESISVLLHNGRCNDAIALVRKYCDGIILSIYKNILSEQINQKLYSGDFESLKNNKIKQWIDTEGRLFEEKNLNKVYKTICDRHPDLTKIFSLNVGNTIYHQLREICNDNMHYNYLYTMMANDACMIRSLKELRSTMINSIDKAIRYFFCIHFSFIYEGNPNHLMSTDYVDFIDCGLTPPLGSERWVSTPAQTAFTQIVKKTHPRVCEYLKELNYMDFEFD